MRSKITVIVPVFNTEFYLARCLDSLLSQTYSDIEVILVDDGSSDGSAKICDEYATKDKRFRVFHRKNTGVSEARNFGILKSTGSYIAFVDSDDYVEDDMLELLYNSLAENDCDISICGYRSFSSTKAEKRTFVNRSKLFLPREALCSMLYQKEIPNSVFGKLYKKDILSNHKFSKNVAIAEDLEFNFNVFYTARRIVYNTNPSYLYFQREGSAMNSFFSLKRMDGLRIVKDIVSRSTFDNAILRAARNRLAMEAIYIATRIPFGKFKVEYADCIKVLKEASLEVLSDTSSKLRYRQYAAITIVNANLLISLLKIRDWIKA